MEFKSLFKNYREEIKKRIYETLDEKEKDYKSRLNTDIDVFEILKNFSTKGKMLRGSLFLFSAESYRKKIDENLLNIAVSLEMMHSALLIHDDIMDNDSLRRGEKTIFSKYKDYAKATGIKNPEHYGISMGIVVGDIALFIAEELAVNSDKNSLQEMLKFYTQELRFVGIGQLLDFSYGAQDTEFSADDIRRMYIDKSARYSFTLPLCLGAISAGVAGIEIKSIEQLGEKMGLIFQLIDDDLGMFGNEDEIGKPVGSDVRENKKTFMRSLLMQKADEALKNELNLIFGNQNISIAELEKVRSSILDLGVRDKIQEEINGLYNEANEKINNLNISNDYKRIFIALLDYNAKRTF